MKFDKAGCLIIRKAKGQVPKKKGEWAILDSGKRLSRVVMSCPICKKLTTLAYLNNVKLSGGGHYINEDGAVFPCIVPPCHEEEIRVHVVKLEDWDYSVVQVSCDAYIASVRQADIF